METLQFSDALDLVQSKGKPHVLLGNGFSRACKDDIFAYEALFDQANFQDLGQHARGAFDALSTRDFEEVMSALQQAANLVRLYGADQEALASGFEADASGLRNVLVEAISGNHPGLPMEISETAYQHCRTFLGSFNRVYSLNYDLLLYWALMQSELDPQVGSDDGFRTPDSGVEEYVTWDPGSSDGQTVYYLHGALHLFDSGSELRKYTWSNTGVSLVEQIRTALESNFYPHFVAEGDSDSKLARIRHSAYLARGERSFLKIAGAAFTYGMSFGESDNHILGWIRKNRLKQLFVGLYGDPNSDANQEIVERVELIKNGRQRDLEVYFYDADSANVWG